MENLREQVAEADQVHVRMIPLSHVEIRTVDKDDLNHLALYPYSFCLLEFDPGLSSQNMIYYIY